MKGPVVAICALLIVPVSAHAQDEPCAAPDPRTCDRFEIIDYGGEVGLAKGWRTDSNGDVTIDYYVNPVQPWVSEGAAITAINRAFDTWAMWNPHLNFRFRGITLQYPTPLDGVNVVGWGGSPSAQASGTPERSSGVLPFGPVSPVTGYFSEFDITFGLQWKWEWLPCEQADGSCTKEARSFLNLESGVTYEIQSVMTHEIGHAIGLDHPHGENILGVLSMAGNDGGSRMYSTLGLGDVLGAKYLYPWACPPEGEPIPPRYQRLCPSIQIFAP